MAEERQTGQILSARPVFRVQNAEASAQYYCDILGFTRNWAWGEPARYISVGRDQTEIHLSETSDPEVYSARAKTAPGNTDFYLYVRDVDALYSELAARGANVLGEPHTEEYGMRDFQVRDLNGYVLAFGQDVSEEDGE